MTQVENGYWFARFDEVTQIVHVDGNKVTRMGDGKVRPQFRFKFLRPVLSQEDADRYQNFDRRRCAKIEQGWDECGACGQDHRHKQNPYDSRYYCEYCGAEALPEDVVEIEGHKRHDSEPEGRTVGEAEALAQHAGDATAYLVSTPVVTASLYGDLDFPAPNHYDPSKRGFNPK